jgi:type II secretory pathway pseudopilin PulG
MLSKMATSVRRALNSSQGFSMVELLVVCLCMGILAAGILGLYYGVQRSFADTTNRVLNQDDARTAMNLAARYIRSAQSSDTNLTESSDAVAVASSQEIVFYADVDGDKHAEKVRYYLEGQNLMMATTEPDLSTAPPIYPVNPTANSIVVMNGIVNGTSPIFTYYQLDPDYFSNPVPGNDQLVVMSTTSTAADRAKISAVSLTVYVNENPGLSKGSVYLESLVQIRQRYNGGISGS